MHDTCSHSIQCIFAHLLDACSQGSTHLAAMPDEEMPPGLSQSASTVAVTAAQTAAATALASILRTSCTIIDMGSFLLSEVRSRPYTADDAALPCIAGEHVRQILPEALAERAALFPPFDRLRQVNIFSPTLLKVLRGCQRY